MSLIRLVTFDATETLIKATQTAGSQYAAAAAKYFNVKYDPAVLQGHFWDCMKSQSKVSPMYGSLGKETPKQWWHSVFTNTLSKAERDISKQHDWKRPYTRAQLDQAFEDVYHNFQWSLCPNVKETLQALKVTRTASGDGMKLCVITNSDDRTSHVLAELGIAIYFDLVVTPVEAKCAKPDAKIFEFACKKSGVKNISMNETLHVGNSYHGDYLGATNAGMQALLLETGADTGNPSDIHEDHLIKDISEVITYVKVGANASVESSV